MKSTITCLACAEPSTWPNDRAYHKHLLDAHGATSSDQAMINERNKAKNTPKDLPPGISQDALPTPEFLEAIKRIEEKPKTPFPPELKPVTAVEIKPPKLCYNWVGNCEVCKFPVKTIMLDVGKRLFAVCWCSNCSKSIKQLEVKPIKEE